MELVGFGDFDGVELLQKLPLFSKLSFDETARLAGIMQRVEVAAGTVLIEENSLGDALYVIQEGEVRVIRDPDLDGDYKNAVEIGRLGVGALFGEMSLMDDLLTSARVQTTQATRVLKLPRRDFENLIGGDEKLAVKVYKSFCRTLSDRLRGVNKQLADKTAQLHATVR